jgi:hypothetical protein
MHKILNWFNKLFGFSSDIGMKTMLGMIARTQEQELACDEVHALIDQFAEMNIRGEDPSHLMPLVQQHLGMCPDCREEYDALVIALQVD